MASCRDFVDNLLLPNKDNWRVQAFENVPETAILEAAHTLSLMLAHTPPTICNRLIEHGADIAIIGRKQVVSDMPPHNHLRDQDCATGNRTFDHGTRGVGGSMSCPTCSVGKNLAPTDIYLASRLVSATCFAASTTVLT